MEGSNTYSGTGTQPLFNPQAGHYVGPSRALTAAAYQCGLSALEASEHDRTEALEAAEAWKRAANDHGETSYFGAGHVRAMRAYWLGIIRQQRALELGFHTFHRADASQREPLTFRTLPGSPVDPADYRY